VKAVNSTRTSIDDDAGNEEPNRRIGIGILIFLLVVCIIDVIISVSIQSCLFPLVKYFCLPLQVFIIIRTFKLAHAIDANQRSISTQVSFLSDQI
jgi:hypothetical protein